MITEYRSTEFDDSVLGGAVGSENIPPVIAYNTELLLVLGAALVVNTLSVFVRTGIAQNGFAATTEICTVEEEEGAMDQTLSNESAESTLLVKD
jgi:hypothetical protein